MKFTLVLFALLTATVSFSQKKNAENYYNYYNPYKLENLKGKQLTTAWLDQTEASKILEEEMKEAGLEWISTFRIVKLNDADYILTTCYSEKSKVGFVYESTHNAFPNKANRQLKSLYKEMTGNDYAEKIVDLEGNSKFIKITELPKNIQLIKEDIYWYQYTENQEDDHKLVSKNDMYQIFRSDVKTMISKFSK